MEFRHPSFDTDEVREKLAAAGVALCVSDTEEQPATLRPHGRLRLRAPPGDGLRRPRPSKAGGTSFRSALAEGTDVYCYLKHEDSASGPRDAAILKRMALD